MKLVVRIICHTLASPFYLIFLLASIVEWAFTDNERSVRDIWRENWEIAKRDLM
jgi:hypothetical protein